MIESSVMEAAPLMYIHESLQSKACSEIDKVGYQDAVWRKVKMYDNDILFIGVIIVKIRTRNL